MAIVNVQIPHGAYDVHIAPGARARIDGIVGGLSGVGRVVIIADAHVADLHLEALTRELRRATVTLRVPPGEASKSLEGAARLYDQLADQRVERGELVIAFGGGMVCDLAGFVAATWLRGVRFVAVPTTLEAAIDASIGGKTAINHPAGKNLIGVFHQPAAVVIDVDFLGTLPDRDHRAGLAESVKHAVIRDAEFFDWHERHVPAIVGRDPHILAELIAWNCRIKAAVVAADEREAGLRAILNYGHTIGHALEHLLGFELRHGECVALGMRVENEIARRRDVLDAASAERIAGLLDGLGLPRRLPRPVAAEQVVDVCRMDKKVRAGAIRAVLASAVGATAQVDDIAQAEIDAALASIQPVG